MTGSQDPKEPVVRAREEERMHLGKGALEREEALIDFFFRGPCQ